MREAISLRSVVDACTFVDRLAPNAVGELVIVQGGGAVVRGSIFIEAGRICWAAARGLAQRLTQLLREPAGIDERTMEEHFRRCRAERIPLGEFLVARGILEPADLRAALLRHTAESLSVLCGDTSADWCLRSGGYSARFTFRTSELLARWFGDVHARARARTCQGVDDALAPFTDPPPGEWCGAFARDRAYSAPLPVAVKGHLPEKSTTLLRVGKWAASALDLAATFQDESAFVSAIEASGAALVAWRHGDLIIAGRMQAQGPARILNHRASLRRK